MLKPKLKILLAQRNMTQRELAELTGIRPPTISAMVNGSAKHLPIEALNDICRVLKCQFGDLYDYVEEESQ